MAPGSMQYFDATWNKYAQQIVDICGEPLESEPTEIEQPDEEIAFTSETEEKLHIYLKGNPLSNMIQVDDWCFEQGKSADECDPGVHLGNGIVTSRYWGTTEFIRCQGYISDSLGEVEKIRYYKVDLDSNRITKIWHSDDFAKMPADELALAKTGFTEYCDIEKGSIVTDTKNEIACEITIEPVNKENVETNDEIPFYNYHDPQWSVYGTKVISACR